MTKSSDQSGFAVVESILVIVIIAILGFTGWFVWHGKQSADKTLNDTAKTSQNSTATDTQAKTTAVTTFAECKASAGSIMQESFPETCVTKAGKSFTDSGQSNAQKYLVIKEWGVELPLSANLADAIYSVINTDAASYDAVGLSTIKLASSSEQCGAEEGGTGILDRQTAAVHDTNAAKNDTSYPVYPIKIGSYYYQYAHPQGACSTDSATITLQSAAINSFRSAFGSLKSNQ